jgi:protein O-GlcNAc transferase
MTHEDQWQRCTDLHRLGKLKEAESAYRDLLQVDPDHIAANHMLGMLLHQIGESHESTQHLEKAIRLGGEQASILANTAKVYLQRGEAEKAIEMADRGLASDPRHFGSLYNKALACGQMNKHPDALWAIDRALGQKSKDAKALLFKANTLLKMGKYGDDRVFFDLAMQNGSEPDECRIGKASSWAFQGRRKAAIESLAAMTPNDITATDLVYQGATIFQKLKAWIDAIEWLDVVISRDPDHVEAHLRRGVFLGLIGDATGSTEEYKQVLQLDPDYHQVHSNFLGRLQYDLKTTAAEIHQAHLSWSLNHASPAPRAAGDFHRILDPTRKIILGWVSPRFHSSITDSFFDSTLLQMPADKFEHVFYQTRATSPRESSPIAQTGVWHQVEALSDSALAQLVDNDKVDILIDLAGHNPGNRLKAISTRLAPIQICWLDYYATTGITAMDYWLTDPSLTPVGNEAYFSEQLLYLPDSRLAYSAPKSSVSTSRSHRATSEIVFGSFNRLGKMTDEVIGVWKTLVENNAPARLILKASELNDQRVRDYTMSRLMNAGFSSDMIELRPESPLQDMLQEYSDIDIALDPFSFTGCATTCDALWMGVPVITLAGVSAVSRQGVSILNAIGKPQWIAENTNEYLKIATQLAQSLRRENFDRASLRERVENAPLCDSKKQAQAISVCLRECWKQYCAKT